MRPFLEPLRLAGRGGFLLPPSHTLPPNTLPAGKEQYWFSNKLTLSSNPAGISSFQQPTRKDEQNHEHWHRPWLAKAAVGYGLDLMLAIFQIIQGMVSTIITRSGLSGSSGTTLPQEIIDKINNVGFWDSIPLWAVTLLGGLFITVLSFIMVLTVYSRMFRLYSAPGRAAA